MTKASSLRRFWILTLICLAISAPVVVITARSLNALDETRQRSAQERQGVADEHIFVPLTFDSDALRAARTDVHAPATKIHMLEERVLDEAGRAAAQGTPRRLAASGCRPFGQWLARERALERNRKVLALADSSIPVEDAACYTRSIAVNSGLADESDDATSDLVLISSMNGPGLDARVADAMALFEDAAASRFRRTVIRTASSIGYVTRNRENIDEAASEIATKRFLTDRRFRVIAGRAETAERHFETSLAAALEPTAWSTRSVPRIERLASDAVAKDRVEVLFALDALDRRLAMSSDAIAGRERVAVATALGGIAFIVFILIVAAREISRRHIRQVAYVAMERDALQAKLVATEMQRSLSLGDGQMRAIFDTVDVGLAIIDRTQNVTQSNDAYVAMRTRLTGLESVTVAYCADIFAGTATRATGEYAFDALHASTTYVTLSLAGVYEDGVCRCVVATITDVSESRRVQQTLLETSLRDPLTGLANRRAFEEMLAGICDASEPSFAVLYLDLNRFKPVNDTYGHEVGDTVLKIVAARIRAGVAREDLAARLGGDEFAILLRNVDDRKAVDRTIARIVASVEQPLVIDATTIHISISVGASLARSDEPRSASRLLAHADSAMYEAKRSRVPAR